MIIHRCNLKILFVLCSFGLVMWMGCSKNDSAPFTPFSPTVTLQSAVPNLIFESTNYISIQAVVSGISPLQVDSVTATLSNASVGIASFRLYDDGGAFTLTDNLVYASDHSGDNVPHDGKFNRLINSLFTLQQGSFTLHISAWIVGVSYNSSNVSIGVYSDTPPQISNLILPDTLESGFAPVQILLQAWDPDTATIGDSVTAVWMKLFSPSGNPYDTTYFLQGAAGNTYVLPLTSPFAVARPTGNYTFRFYVRDTYNLISDSGRVVFMANSGSYITNPTYPHVLQLPNIGSDSILITLRVWDEQSYLDIASVYLYSVKPNGDTAFAGNPIPMVDNGLHPLNYSLPGYLGDLTAGDSLYSTTAVLFDTSQTGTYRFTFYSRDNAGNLTGPLADSLIVNP